MQGQEITCKMRMGSVSASIFTFFFIISYTFFMAFCSGFDMFTVRVGSNVSRNSGRSGGSVIPNRRTIRQHFITFKRTHLWEPNPGSKNGEEDGRVEDHSIKLSWSVMDRPVEAHPLIYFLLSTDNQVRQKRRVVVSGGGRKGFNLQIILDGRVYLHSFQDNEQNFIFHDRVSKFRGNFFSSCQPFNS